MHRFSRTQGHKVILLLAFRQHVSQAHPVHRVVRESKRAGTCSPDSPGASMEVRPPYSRLWLCSSGDALPPSQWNALTGCSAVGVRGSTPLRACSHKCAVSTCGACMQ